MCHFGQAGINLRGKKPAHNFLASGHRWAEELSSLPCGSTRHLQAIKTPKPELLGPNKRVLLTCDGVRLGHQPRQTSADGVTVPVGAAGGAGPAGAGVTRVRPGALDLGTGVRNKAFGALAEWPTLLEMGTDWKKSSDRCHSYILPVECTWHLCHKGSGHRDWGPRSPGPGWD